MCDTTGKNTDFLTKFAIWRKISLTILNMEQYIVSARKYRPDSFGTLIGQDNIAKTLKNSIRSGQLAHAYLFCGPRGVGKTSTARIFAKTINCMSPTPDMEPCGHCESCVSFDEGRSYCIHELDAASNNGVEDIKQLMDKVRIPPQVGKYSVYIIDEVHMLSQAAFNAFLKTLEEPPAHAIFVLATTEKHKILPTILSRCQTYDFNRIGIEDIVRNLRGIAAKEGVEIGDEALHVIAAKADGAMRDALTLFDQSVAFCGKNISYEEVISNLNVLDYDYYFRLIDYFKARDHVGALLLFDEVLSKGFNSLYFISGLSRHIRDLIVSKSASAAPLIELPESLKKRYEEQAAGLSLGFLYAALDITVKCEMAYKTSINQRLLIEFALMRLSVLSAPVDGAAVAAEKPVSGQAAPERHVPADAAQGKQAFADTALEKRVPADAVPAKRVPADAASELKRKRTGYSISAMMEGNASGNGSASRQTSANAQDGHEDVKAELTMDKLKQLWMAMAEQYKSKKNLYSTLSTARVELEHDGNKNIVRFYVVNEAQKEWIMNKLHRELETRLRTGSGVHDILLAIEVEPYEKTEAVPYMPSEKAKYMMEKSPEVRNLCDDLGLDLK